MVLSFSIKYYLKVTSTHLKQTSNQDNAILHIQFNQKNRYPDKCL